MWTKSQRTALSDNQAPVKRCFEMYQWVTGYIIELDLIHIFLRTLLLYQSVKPKTTLKPFVFTILTSQKDVDQTKSDILPVTA